MSKDIEADKALITALGGPAHVAGLLKLDKYGTQRVSNWLVRGIPSRIKLEFPELFLPGMRRRKDRA